MYNIYYYRDRRGNSPFADYLEDLASKTDKNSRIRAGKIYDYLDILRQFGTAAGAPYIKHINGNIWELRPMRDRVLFAAWDGNSFIILHHFVKKTQKTPRREIDQAKRNLTDHIERGLEDE